MQRLNDLATGTQTSRMGRRPGAPCALRMGGVEREARIRLLNIEAKARQ